MKCRLCWQVTLSVISCQQSWDLRCVPPSSASHPSSHMHIDMLSLLLPRLQETRVHTVLHKEGGWNLWFTEGKCHQQRKRKRFLWHFFRCMMRIAIYHLPNCNILLGTWHMSLEYNFGALPEPKLFFLSFFWSCINCRSYGWLTNWCVDWICKQINLYLVKQQRILSRSPPKVSPLFNYYWLIPYPLSGYY